MNIISLSPFAPESLVSRNWFGRPVPSQPAHSPHSGWIWCLLTGFFPLSMAAFICPYCQPPSGQSRVYQVTQLRTDSVHCRESASTGPVVLKIVPVMIATFSGITMDQLMCASLFPHPLMVCSGHINSHSMCDTESMGGDMWPRSLKQFSFMPFTERWMDLSTLETFPTCMSCVFRGYLWVNHPTSLLSTERLVNLTQHNQCLLKVLLLA